MATYRLTCALVQLLTQPADSQEEITARHHIADQLERRFIPRPLCKSSLFAEFNNELKILKEAVHSGSGQTPKPKQIFFPPNLLNVSSMI